MRIDRRAFVRWTGGGLLIGAAGAQALIEACSSPALAVSNGPAAAPGATSQPATTPVARAAATPEGAIKGKNAAAMPTYVPSQTGDAAGEQVRKEYLDAIAANA